MNKGLGRRTPSDFTHVTKFPYGAVAPVIVKEVNKSLKLPSWHWSWDQGEEGACVGFGTSMMMSVLNEQQARADKLPPYSHLYNARWLWNEAKKIDEFPDTNPGDDNGTTVRAGCDVLRTLGHVRVLHGVDRPADITQGIKTNRWARTVDEMRTSIASGIPVSIGINWYSNFDTPKVDGNYWRIGDGDLGYIRGGHCVCIYGASDRRQAFRVKNSWGRDYPIVWLGYKTMERLLREDGEAALVTDQ
jgi:hypothetical protein